MTSGDLFSRYLNIKLTSRSWDTGIPRWELHLMSVDLKSYFTPNGARGGDSGSVVSSARLIHRFGNNLFHHRRGVEMHSSEQNVGCTDFCEVCRIVITARTMD